jgi:glycerol-3-phosphate acyltransferase PlsY
MLQNASLILAAYLLGSIATAVLVSRALGVADPRTHGSHNPGATNMLRLGGKSAGAITLAGDMLKGLAAVLAARAFDVPPQVLAAVGLAAFLGHLYPVFLRFRGGKGVATALGVILAWHWPAGLATMGTWLAVAFLFRYSSLAALVAALAAPGYLWWLQPEPVLAGTCVLMSALLWWRHRENIRHLLAGTEGRIEL